MKDLKKPGMEMSQTDNSVNDAQGSGEMRSERGSTQSVCLTWMESAWGCVTQSAQFHDNKAENQPRLMNSKELSRTPSAL